MAGIAGLAQVQCRAQAVLDNSQPEFGSGAAPYAQSSAVPAEPVVQPAAAAGAVYAPGSIPGAYAPQAAGSEGELGVPDPNQPLARGDIVSFSIAQDREAPQIMRVTDTGELDFSQFPKIGRISVAGRDCAEVASELKHQLEADYYYHADVTLGIDQVNQSDSRGRVYLSGNVRAPGPEDLPANERTTLSMAIIRAGGFAQFANDRRVQLTRKDKDGKPERYIIDVKSIIQNGRTDRDMELQDGDYINVPQKTVNW
jgi:polysaccharide export outer membrane protein